jgi:hypothetical protein
MLVSSLLTHQVVAFYVYSDQLPRVLNITKDAIDNAGLDFYSYSWIDLGSTEVIPLRNLYYLTLSFHHYRRIRVVFIEELIIETRVRNFFLASRDMCRQICARRRLLTRLFAFSYARRTR